MIKIPSMQDLLEAGVHFGHQIRRGNPRMGEYIFGAREGVHIINLEFSESKLKEAAQFVEKLGSEGKVLLFIGTKKQAQSIIEDAAKSIHAPFLNIRWMGGLLTNFDEIRKNINNLVDLQIKQREGKLTHYTKKEQLLISRKLEKFNKELGGVANMDKLPDALYVIDCVTEKIAVDEANKLKIAIVAIADSNCNPALLDYPIPGNDDAIKSIKIITDTITQAYGEGLKKAGKIEGRQEDKKQLEAEGLQTMNKEDKVKNSKKEEEKKEIVDEAISAEVAAAEDLIEKAAVKDADREVIS